MNTIKMNMKKLICGTLTALVACTSWATANVTWSLGGAFDYEPAAGVWVGSSEGGGEQITSGHLYLCFTTPGSGDDMISQLTKSFADGGLEDAGVDAMTTFLAANSQWNGYNANNPNFSANCYSQTGGAFGTPPAGQDSPSAVTINGIDMDKSYDVVAIIFDTQDITADSKYVVIKGFGELDFYMESDKGFLEVGFGTEWYEGDIDHGMSSPNNAVDGQWHLVGIGGETVSSGETIESISYRDYIDGAFETAEIGGNTGIKYTVVTSDMTEWSEGWYVVTGNVTMNGGITVSGNVKLILADESKLTVNGAANEAGIRVSGDGNSLTIYGQTNGTGELTATGGKYGAGIGGDNRNSGISNGNNITINGGIVTAIGGTCAAGIGGGGWGSTGYGMWATYSAGSGNNIKINGGTVTATGGNGYSQSFGMWITSYGPGSGIGGGGAGTGYNMDGSTATGFNDGSSDITVSTAMTVLAGDSNPPEDEIVNGGGDLASALAGKLCVVAKGPEKPESIVVKVSVPLDPGYNIVAPLFDATRETRDLQEVKLDGSDGWATEYIYCFDERGLLTDQSYSWQCPDNSGLDDFSWVDDGTCEAAEGVSYCPGQGFEMYADGEGLSVEVEVDIAKPLESCSLDLQLGYNFVGNPYCVPISLQNFIIEGTLGWATEFIYFLDAEGLPSGDFLTYQNCEMAGTDSDFVWMDGVSCDVSNVVIPAGKGFVLYVGTEGTPLTLRITPPTQEELEEALNASSN